MLVANKNTLELKFLQKIFVSSVMLCFLFLTVYILIKIILQLFAFFL